MNIESFLSTNKNQLLNLFGQIYSARSLELLINPGNLDDESFLKSCCLDAIYQFRRYGEDLDFPIAHVGVRWFVKLDGAAAVAILEGSDPAVFDWYERHGESLLGFRVEATGRLFDADQEKGYRGMGQALRGKLGIAPDAQLWMFDAAASRP